MYAEGGLRDGYGDKDGSFSEGLRLSLTHYTVIMWQIHCTLADLYLT